MDDILYFQLNIANGVNGTEEFQLPFYLLLNLAVGGNWPGYPDATTVFPAELTVDYVRVYAFDPSASATELNNSILLFYPNPTCDVLTFENPTFEKVNILSLDGKLIAEKSLVSNSIDISTFENGIYLVSVISEKGSVITKRFVKN
jgi:beta-glucanase (GH16 family)